MQYNYFICDEINFEKVFVIRFIYPYIIGASPRRVYGFFRHTFLSGKNILHILE